METTPQGTRQYTKIIIESCDPMGMMHLTSRASEDDCLALAMSILDHPFNVGTKAELVAQLIFRIDELISNDDIDTVAFPKLLALWRAFAWCAIELGDYIDEVREKMCSDNGSKSDESQRPDHSHSSRS